MVDLMIARPVRTRLKSFDGAVKIELTSPPKMVHSGQSNFIKVVSVTVFAQAKQLGILRLFQSFAS
jgi:hypothetical protein